MLQTTKLGVWLTSRILRPSKSPCGLFAIDLCCCSEGQFVQQLGTNALQTKLLASPTPPK
jgi:hypothetical protein